MNIFKKLKNRIQSFFPAREGVAAVEFALILPIMLLIYLGTTEVSRAISYHSRIVTISAALGDLVGQSDEDIPMSQLNNYFDAALTIIAPYPSAGVRQIVTSVYVRPNGSTRVNWSFAHNGGTAHAVNSSFTLPDNIRNISRDNFIIVSEASLSYAPMMTYIFPRNLEFYQKYYHLPRGNNGIDIL